MFEIVCQIVMKVCVAVGGQTFVLFGIEVADAVLEFELFFWGGFKFICLMGIRAVRLPEVAHLCPQGFSEAGEEAGGFHAHG
jgi:hypothetical protein